MRALFSCRPGFGHFQPLAPLAAALLAAGHGVRFACPPEMVQVIEGAGFEAEGVGLTDAELRVRRVQEVPELRTAAPDQLRSLIFPRVFADLEVAARLPGLRALAGRYAPDLIVHEMAEFAGPLLAALLGLPSVNHSFGPLVAADILAEAGGCAAMHWRAAGLPVPERAGMYDGLYLDLCPPSLQEAHIGSVARVQPIRCVPSADRGEAPWLAELGRRPVVTVTLGTVFNKRPGLYRTLIDGLRDLAVDGVVALGPGVDPAAIGTLPDNVRAFPWVPWTRLLEKTAVVVGHGGAGSTLGPLSRGIPLVVVPLGADHFVNAARIVQARAGLVLDEARLDPASVRDAVEQAFSPETRASARRIAEEMAAMPSAGEVVPVLEAYVRRGR